MEDLKSKISELDERAFELRKRAADLVSTSGSSDVQPQAQAEADLIQRFMLSSTKPEKESPTWLALSVVTASSKKRHAASSASDLAAFAQELLKAAGNLHNHLAETVKDCSERVRSDARAKASIIRSKKGMTHEELAANGPSLTTAQLNKAVDTYTDWIVGPMRQRLDKIILEAADTLTEVERILNSASSDSATSV